jgi:sporulation protein YlmC with PRC-barrel domain
MNVPRKKTYLMLAAALGMSMALSVSAADNKPMNQADTKPRNQASAPAGKKMHATTAAAHGMRASQLIGTDVTNAQGENLGEIEDLVINTATGKVDYAVLQFGGFLGMGDKLFAYPLERFKPASNQRGKLSLDVDKEKLKGSPGFDSKAWPDLNRSDYRAQVDRHYGYQSGTKPRFVRASDMLKGDVKDGQRKDIGDIEDIVVDVSTGKVQFVVVEFDRAWNPIDKLVAMPLRTLTSEDKDGTDLVYAASREELKGAPAFDKSAWPDLSSAAFRNDMERYDRQWKPAPQRTSQVTR